MSGPRAALEARWLDLTCRALPGVARARGWPVTQDHCFQRILLDHACGGVWYTHVPRRPAYRHADTRLLERAVALGDAALQGTADMHALNEKSIGWRTEARKRS